MGTANTTLSSGPWRHGLTHWVTFELYPEWTGSTFYGFKGMAYHRINYTTGTLVVLKTFRHREGTAIDWIPYKERCDVARKMAASFNKTLAKKTCDTKITVVKPVDVVMDNTSCVMLFMRLLVRFDKKFRDDEVVLFEEFLKGDFKTFISFNGLATGNSCDMLDAFCHFTYYESKGDLVLCNLKGIENSGEYKLSNPTIHSRGRHYGNADKGHEGIKTFFINHTCNVFCKNFAKPDTKNRSLTDFGESLLTDKSLNSNEEQTLIERGMVRPPEYSLSDTFGPPSYTT